MTRENSMSQEHRMTRESKKNRPRTKAAKLLRDAHNLLIKDELVTMSPHDWREHMIQRITDMGVSELDQLAMLMVVNTEFSRLMELMPQSAPESESLGEFLDFLDGPPKPPEPPNEKFPSGRPRSRP